MKRYLVALSMAACWFGWLYSGSVAKAETPKAHTLKESEISKSTSISADVFVSCAVHSRLFDTRTGEIKENDRVDIYRLSHEQPAVMLWLDDQKQTAYPCDGNVCGQSAVTPNAATWSWVDDYWSGTFEINRVTGDYSGTAYSTRLKSNHEYSGQCSKIDDPTVGVKPKF